MEDQVTKEKAIELCNSKFYEKMTDEEIFLFQINQEKLCMPFEVFHRSTEKALKRPVFTHEFAFVDFKKEYYKKHKS